MVAIIAGCREVDDTSYLCPMAQVGAAVTASGWALDRVITGGARGYDTVAKQWADLHSIPNHVEWADWDHHGPKRAGRIRNTKMEPMGEGLIAIWDGVSTGTAHMIELMEKARKPVYIYGIRGCESGFRIPTPAKSVLRVRTLYD